MPRVPDLGITIGLLPPGPTGSVLDVPGAGLGHATVWRDEPPPPAGRGTARTGVTVIDPGGDLFRFPGPGRRRGAQRGGRMHRPAGRAGMGTGRDAGVPHLDHATGPGLRRGLRAAHRRAGRDRRRGRDHPHRGRMRRQFPQRKPPDASAAGRRTGRAGGGPGVRRGEGRPRGRGRGGHRDELPGIQGRHRDRVPRGAGRGDRRGGHDDQLRRPGAAHRGRGAGRAAAARPRRVRRPAPGPRGRASWWCSPTGRWTRPPASGWPAGPAWAWPGWAAPRTTPAGRSSWPWPPGCARPGGPRRPVPGHRRRAGRLLRRRGRGHRGGRAEQPAASRDRHRPGRPHLVRAARRAAARTARGPGGTAGRSG